MFIKHKISKCFFWQVCATTGKSYTYFELRTLSGRFAASLINKCKLVPGTTIAIILPNIPEYAIIILGSSEAGMKVSSAIFKQDGDDLE